MAVLPSLADIESPRLRHAIFWTGAGFCAAGAAVVYHWNREAAGFFPTCPLRTYTGYSCPGCGALRALHQLLHGHIGAALGYNRLFVLSVPFVAYWVISEVFLLLGGPALPRIPAPDKLMWLVFAICDTFCGGRKIPYYTLTLLAPHSTLFNNKKKAHKTLFRFHLIYLKTKFY